MKTLHIYDGVLLSSTDTVIGKAMTYGLEDFRSSSATSITRCGYLFLAPPTFPVTQSKRWQRRWFVLTDGLLSYSLDEDPETIPQGIIDMNQVENVMDGDKETGITNSIVIKMRGLHNNHPAPSILVQSISPREKKCWFDVLSRFVVVDTATNSATTAIRKEGNVTKNGERILTQMTNGTPFKETTQNYHNEKMRFHFNNQHPCPYISLRINNFNGRNNGKNPESDHDKTTTAQHVNNNNCSQQQQQHTTTKSFTAPNQSVMNNRCIKSLPDANVMRQKLHDMSLQVKRLEGRIGFLIEELRNSYENYDYLEIAYERMKQRAALRDRQRESELELLRMRVNHLTAKLCDKQHQMHSSSSSNNQIKLTDAETVESKSIIYEDRVDSQSLLNRLQELSSSVRKISDSLHSFCDNTSRPLPLVRTQSDPQASAVI